MIDKIIKYFQGIVTESKAITWPSKIKVYNDSLIVVVSLIVGGLVVAGIDFLFLELFKYAISKVG